MIARRLPFPARHATRLCLIAGGLFSASFSSLADTIPGSVIDPAIDAYLLNMVDEEHLSGVVLVTRGGDIVHAKGYGTAAGDSPNTVDTAFHIASVSKQFTAAAVLQLVERGKVDLDRSINTYLPERYRTPAWDKVTVHHLLSHSGGVPDYGVTRDYYDVVDGFCLGDTVDGMIREAMDRPLEFEPGTQYAYSNIGFTLLGEIIETQSGTPYARYLDENILEPMGMVSSRVHVEGHVPAINEASGYRWDDDSGQHVKDDVVSLPVTAPDGGLVTTLDDFLRWIRVYQSGDPLILAPESLARMITSHIATDPDRPDTGYGYGLDVNGRLIGHSGYIVGFRSRFDYDRKSDTLVVVFTNNTANNPARISSGLLTLLFGASS